MVVHQTSDLFNKVTYTQQKIPDLHLLKVGHYLFGGIVVGLLGNVCEIHAMHNTISILNRHRTGALTGFLGRLKIMVS